MKVTCRLLSTATGFFFIILGIGLLWSGAKHMIHTWAWEVITLRNNTETTQRWVRSEPVYIKVFIFNVTNPEEVGRGVKPKLAEIGPYVYENKEVKFDIFAPERHIWSYRLNSSVRFEKKASGHLKESDEIIVLNVPHIGSLSATQEAIPNNVEILDETWESVGREHGNLLIKTTVTDLLFDGVTIDCSVEATACRAFNAWKSILIRRDGNNFKFSFLHHKNGTVRQDFQVDRGVLNLIKADQFVSINNSTSTTTWQGTYCNMINGSDGSQFPMSLKKKDKLYIYERDICRSFWVEFEKVVHKGGMLLYRYIITKGLLLSKDEDPANECFCRLPYGFPFDDAEGPRPDNESLICLKSGLLSAAPCTGFPLVVSFPHFYLADERGVHGSDLIPTKELHQTYFDIEPTLGIAISSAKRFQFNVAMGNSREIANALGPDDILPILWIEESTEISNEFFDHLSYILVKKLILKYGMIAIFGLGILFVLAPLPYRFIEEKFIDRKGYRGDLWQKVKWENLSNEFFKEEHIEKTKRNLTPPRRNQGGRT